MIDYSKPSFRYGLDHFILGAETYNLKSDNNPECIAEQIIDLAVFPQNGKRDVSIANIIVRTDNKQLNQNATEFNNHLLEFCREMNLSLIDTSKRTKPLHLYKSELHMSKSGSRILRDIYYKKTQKYLIYHYQIINRVLRKLTLTAFTYR